jgi:hypothetical protein
MGFNSAFKGLNIKKSKHVDKGKKKNLAVLCMAQSGVML